jgi:hypothetical protein
MQAINELEPRLQLAVDMRISGLDIMHGELKVLMVDTENRLAEYTDHDNEQYDQTVDRLRLEGYLDALSDLYQLTYQLSFAIMDKEKEQE